MKLFNNAETDAKADHHTADVAVVAAPPMSPKAQALGVPFTRRHEALSEELRTVRSERAAVQAEHLDLIETGRVDVDSTLKAKGQQLEQRRRDLEGRISELRRELGPHREAHRAALREAFAGRVQQSAEKVLEGLAAVNAGLADLNEIAAVLRDAGDTAAAPIGPLRELHWLEHLVHRIMRTGRR